MLASKMVWIIEFAILVASLCTPSAVRLICPNPIRTLARTDLRVSFTVVLLGIRCTLVIRERAPIISYLISAVKIGLALSLLAWRNACFRYASS
ncbi:hypothetical protein BGZ63DRAFT_388178 [Mariannaea sp. PMI_226]|nr:hypothetical protein BGZ63DRAFT_388178 [Mariannaea sp. PMI_226]